MSICLRFGHLPLIEGYFHKWLTVNFNRGYFHHLPIIHICHGGQGIENASNQFVQVGRHGGAWAFYSFRARHRKEQVNENRPVDWPTTRSLGFDGNGGAPDGQSRALRVNYVAIDHLHRSLGNRYAVYSEGNHTSIVTSPVRISILEMPQSSIKPTS